MIEIKQPTQNEVRQQYVSTVQQINKVEECYREILDELYTGFCVHPCRDTAHKDLQDIIDVLQELKDISDF